MGGVLCVTAVAVATATAVAGARAEVLRAAMRLAEPGLTEVDTACAPAAAAMALPVAIALMTSAMLSTSAPLRQLPFITPALLRQYEHEQGAAFGRAVVATDEGVHCGRAACGYGNVGSAVQLVRDRLAANTAAGVELPHHFAGS